MGSDGFALGAALHYCAALTICFGVTSGVAVADFDRSIKRNGRATAPMVYSRDWGALCFFVLNGLCGILSFLYWQWDDFSSIATLSLKKLAPECFLFGVIAATAIRSKFWASDENTTLAGVKLPRKYGPELLYDFALSAAVTSYTTNSAMRKLALANEMARSAAAISDSDCVQFRRDLISLVEDILGTKDSRYRESYRAKLKGIEVTAKLVGPAEWAPHMKYLAEICVEFTSISIIRAFYTQHSRITFSQQSSEQELITP